MSFHIQFNNVSTCNITAPLIKKPEKDFGFNAVGRGCGKMWNNLSLIVTLASLQRIGFTLPVWDITEGAFHL